MLWGYGMCFRFRVMEAWGGMECSSVLGFSVMGLWNVLPFSGDGGMG